MTKFTPEIFNPVRTRRPYTAPFQELVLKGDGLLVDGQVILTASPRPHGGKPYLSIFASQGTTILRADQLKIPRFQERDGSYVKILALRIAPRFPLDTVYIGNDLKFRCISTGSGRILCELDSTHPIDIQTVSRDENFLTYLKHLRHPYGQRS